jgi:hypothetical protein
MRLKTLLFISALSLSTLLGAQTTCTAKSTAVPFGIQTTENTSEHDATAPSDPAGTPNDHHATASPTGTCTYSHGNTGLSSCDTVCGVITAPVVEYESPNTLVQGTSGFHQVAHIWADGASAALAGPTSCSASFGGAAINCGAALGVKCALGVTLNAGVITVTPAPSERTIWTSGVSTFPLNCPAVSDPQAPTGGHFIPPDPCLDGPSALVGGRVTGRAINDPSCSPILIDTTGAGIELIRANFGPQFDLRGAGVKSVVSWTRFQERSVGFLALDRNGNGTIDNGTELFGNFTAQPDSPNKNGFAALAEFDKPENGGNGDGVISSLDAVWPKLRIWIDYNHDGVSEPDELKPLSFYHIEALDLNYHEDKHTDQWGNAFRYKAKVISDNSGKGVVGRWAVDVFLTVLDMHPDEHQK